MEQRKPQPIHLVDRDYDKDPTLVERLDNIDKKLDTIDGKLNAALVVDENLRGRLQRQEDETNKHADEIEEIRSDVAAVRLSLAEKRGQEGVIVWMGRLLFGALGGTAVWVLNHFAGKR